MRREMWSLQCVLALALLIAAACTTVPAPPQADRATLAARFERAIESGDESSALATLPTLELRLEQELGDEPTALATALEGLAVELFVSFGSPEAWERVEGLWTRALELRSGAPRPDPRSVAETRLNLAVLVLYRGEWERAERLASRALDGLDELESTAVAAAELAHARLTLGQALFKQGRFGDAEAPLERAVALHASAAAAAGADDPESASARVESLSALAELYRMQNRWSEAERLLEEGLGLARRSPLDGLDLFTPLTNLGLLYKDLGDYARAERLLDEALARLERLERPEETAGYELAIAHHNRAELLRIQGRYDEAAAGYARALGLARSILGPRNPELIWFLNQQAVLWTERERFERAAPLYREALELADRALPETHPLLAQTIHDAADLHRRRLELGEAKRLYRRALAIRETGLGSDHPEVAVTLTQLARCLHQEGETAPALRLVERALAIFATTSVYPWARADAHALRAELLDAQARLAGAIAELDAAIRLIEEQRPQIGGGEASRAEFLGRYLGYYNTMVDWQVRAGAPELALEYAERARARVFLDQLAAGGVDLRSDIPVAVRRPLEADEARVKRLIAELQQRLAYTRERTDLPARELRRRLGELDRELEAATRELQRLVAELRVASPLWRELVTAGGRVLPLATLQAELVPDDGQLLLYQLGEEASFLFSLPPAPAPLAVFALSVEAPEAEVLGIHPGRLTRGGLELAIAGGVVGGERPGLIARLRGERGLVKVSGDLPPPAIEAERLHALWRTLVPETLWREIEGSAQVLLVPDGVLHQLPFEALVVALTAPQPTYWLDAGPTLRYAPSATAVYNLERRASAGAEGAAGAVVAGGGSVLVVADPLFAPAAAEAAPDDETPPTRAAYLRAGGRLERLPGTAREAEAIARVFADAGESGTVSVLRGSGAREPQVRREVAGRQRYLHFATHGLVEEGRHELLAALALTPPPEGVSGSEDDGFLQLFEIYELELGAELAVLSACDSHLGRRVAGEGVFALSRGFLAAGARRVVASQWPVDDASTAVLMAELYRRLVEAERRGEPPRYATALRDARRAIRRQPAWSAPFYWAPFVLVGVE